MRRRRHRRVLGAAALLLLAALAAGLVLARLPDRGIVPERAVREDAEARFDRLFRAGIEALRAGLPDEAARAFAAARRLRPEVVEATVDLAFAELLRGRHAHARALFTEAVALRPGQVNAWYGLAEALAAAGDLPGALGAMRTFLHLAPPDDRFRRRAMAAVWEWESTLDADEAADGPDLLPVVGPGGRR